MSMIEDFDVLSRQIVRLHDQNDSARRIIDAFASGEGDDFVTTTDDALSTAGLQPQQRIKITEIFKHLEDIGCGRFIPGRKMHPSRFVWEKKPATITEALKGPRREIASEPSATDEEATQQAPSRLITYRFPMRGDFLDVRLPFDLGRAEAERLAQFIESLATEP